MLLQLLLRYPEPLSHNSAQQGTCTPQGVCTSAAELHAGWSENGTTKVKISRRGRGHR